VLFGKRGQFVIKKKGESKHSSYNSLKYLYLYGMFNGTKILKLQRGSAAWPRLLLNKAFSTPD
jgi:hypothetical protein